MSCGLLYLFNVTKSRQLRPSCFRYNPDVISVNIATKLVSQRLKGICSVRDTGILNDKLDVARLDGLMH